MNHDESATRYRIELKNKEKLKAEFDKLSPKAKELLIETLEEMRKPEKLKEIGEGLERGKNIILGLNKQQNEPN